MEITIGVIIGIIVIGLAVMWEYRLRQPDELILYESRDRIGIRKSIFYPRHLSLALKRTTVPIRLTVEAMAKGNIGVRVKLVGSVAPSPEHIANLIRVGGWSTEAVAHAANETQVWLEGMVKGFTETTDIHALSATSILNYLNEHSNVIVEKLGVELVSLTVQSLEPTDPAIADALRQRQQASLLEETERLNQQARVAAAKAKYQAEQEIAEREHALELRKVELKQVLLEKESALARQRLEEELARGRMRLAFEKEGLDVLRASPELLMLTPQAARLAEASQSFKNARTVIALGAQELDHGSELFALFQNLLQKALETKRES
jgi:archaeosine-15-forming tRNA-guanine transglycosylase